VLQGAFPDAWKAELANFKAAFELAANAKWGTINWKGADFSPQRTTLACQVGISFVCTHGHHIRFVLDGLTFDAKHAKSVTFQELIYIHQQNLPCVKFYSEHHETLPPWEIDPTGWQKIVNAQ